MRTLQLIFKLFLALTFICTALLAYLAIQHPFLYSDLGLLIGQLTPKSLTEPDPSITTVQQLDDFIAAQLEANEIPGAAIAIVADGKVIWSHGYGFANRESGLEATADTPFMAASISKAVTAVGIMHAVESGHLDLDADINEYLDFTVINPHFQDSGPITLRHLATHTSGIKDGPVYLANTYASGDPAVPLDQFLHGYLVQDGEDFWPNRSYSKNQPGTNYDYSNVGSALAGHLLGSATGVDLPDYLNEHVFTPLGMDNSHWYLADFDDVSQIARPYALRNKPLDHYSYPHYPSGTLRSSANDLGRLLAAIMNGGRLDDVQILKAETVEAMLAKQSYSGLEGEDDSGIFWNYSTSGLIGHSGGNHGVSTFMYFNQETEVGAVILTNGNPPRAIEPTVNILRQITSNPGNIDWGLDAQASANLSESSD